MPPRLLAVFMALWVARSAALDAAAGARPAALDVRAFGAKGDGAADDTRALQAALSAGVSRASRAGGAMAVVFPPGTFLVSRSLVLGTGQVVVFSGGTRLATAPGGFSGDEPILVCSGNDHVRIVGNSAVIEGRKDEPRSGEGRAGLVIDGCEDVSVEDLQISGVAGDGLTVTGYRRPSRHVRISGVRVTRAARNGLSIINAEDLVVERSTFSGAARGARGAAAHGPWSGIDLEPNAPWQFLSGIEVREVRTAANAGPGILFALQNLGSASMPVDVRISSWMSVGDGAASIGRGEAGLRAAPSGSGGRVQGEIQVSQAVIERPWREGVRIEGWNARAAPGLTFRSVRVVNPGEGSDPEPSARSGFAVLARTDRRPGPVGNVRLIECAAVDVRAQHRMTAGVYLEGSDDAHALERISVHGTTATGQLAPGGAVVARGKVEVNVD